MRFDSPVVLVVGLLVVAALAVVAMRAARTRAARLAEAGVAGGRSSTAALGCTLAGVALIAVAAAGPSASVPVPRSAGTVVLAVDVSNSMAATDVRPSRLAAAQRAARAFIAAQPASVDIGVVAFEQGALTTAKPDADHGVALAAVNRLRVSGGTSLAAAVLASLGAITGRTVHLGRGDAVPAIGHWPSATVVVLSDGEDRGRAADLQAAATTAEDAGVHVATVGIGSAAGTTVEVDGFRVRTALDAAPLRALARTTGGSYRPAADAAALDAIGSSIDTRLTVADRQLPLAGALLVPAVVLLVIGAALTLRRSGRIV